MMIMVWGILTAFLAYKLSRTKNEDHEEEEDMSGEATVGLSDGERIKKIYQGASYEVLQREYSRRLNDAVRTNDEIRAFEDLIDEHRGLDQ